MSHCVLVHPLLEAGGVPSVGVWKQKPDGLEIVLPLPVEDARAAHGEDLDVTGVLGAELVELPEEMKPLAACLLGAENVDQRESVGLDVVTDEEVDVVRAKPLLVLVNVPGDFELESLEA